MEKSSNSQLETDGIRWSAADVVIALLISALSLFCVAGVMRFVESIPELMKENYELVVSMAAGVLYLIGKYPIERNSYGIHKEGIKKTLAWGFAGGAILSAINFPLKDFAKGVAWKKFEAFVALNPGRLSIGVFLAFSIVILPILEEIFFRGCVYRILRQRLNTFLSVLITSSVFAIGHGDMVFFLYSLILIGTLEGSSYLGASIVAHITWNATWYLSVLVLRS